MSWFPVFFLATLVACTPALMQDPIEHFALRALAAERAEVYRPDIRIAVSATQVLIQENATFTPLNGVAPFTFRVSRGGGRIDPSGLFTAGAVLGSNTITATDATGNFGRASINVSGGLGDGTFMGSVIYAANILPTSVHSGDFTGDGVVDVVVGTDGAPQAMRLFEGNGDGTFQAGTSNTNDGGMRSITVGDFNADGNLDLAVTDSSANNTVVVLFGDGAGNFSVGPQLGSGGTTHMVHCRDLNDDDRMDLAVVNFGGQEMRVFIGN